MKLLKRLTVPVLLLSIVVSCSSGGDNLPPVEDVIKPSTKEQLQALINDDSIDVSKIDTSMITDMSGLFKDNTIFNGDISGWDVSNVRTMQEMFQGASFNGDISAWDVSSVTNMANMFTRASSFNRDISAWDVSSVRFMISMFSRASSFNRDISAWDVSSVTNMIQMFFDATSFRQNLSSWIFPCPGDVTEMFLLSGIPNTVLTCTP